VNCANIQSPFHDLKETIKICWQCRNHTPEPWRTPKILHIKIEQWGHPSPECGQGNEVVVVEEKANYRHKVHGYNRTGQVERIQSSIGKSRVIHTIQRDVEGQEDNDDLQQKA